MTIPTAARIRQIRLALGESQHAFADRLGTHPNVVHRWEAGVHKPRNYDHVAALMDLDKQLAEKENQ